MSEPSPAEHCDPGDQPAVPLIVMLCTGNAARSVMASAMLEASGAIVAVVSAGTHVIEHQPMSIRTRSALAAVGLEAPKHRSRQLTEHDIDRSDLIVAMAAEHVRFVRRRHVAAAGRTATIAWLSEHLPTSTGSLADRVASMGLADVDPEAQGDVADPAGGTEADYVACAEQLQGMVAKLFERLGPEATAQPA